MPTLEQIAEWEKKATKWDALAADIAEFYPDYTEDGSEIPAIRQGDLADIGEVAATAFGWL